MFRPSESFISNIKRDTFTRTFHIKPCHTGQKVGIVNPSSAVVETPMNGNAHLSAGVPKLTVPSRDVFMGMHPETLFDAALEMLRQYPGCVRLQGFDVEHLNGNAAIAFVRELGEMLGTPMAQNPSGDVVYFVRDEGAIGDTPGYRFSKTRKALVFHTDGAPMFMDSRPDFFMLLMLEEGVSGGESMLVPSRDVISELQREAPHVLALLREPWCFDRSSATPHGKAPFTRGPIVESNGGIRYNRQRIQKAFDLLHLKLTDDQQNALDVLDNVLAREHLQIRLTLRKGDALLVDDRRTLHNRAAYVDGPTSKRCLARVWLQRGDWA